MGLRLLADGKADIVASLAQTAMNYPDDSGLLREIASRLLALKIPGFHQSMLHDNFRNSAYAEGMVAVVPGRTVLDIGTGSGLLAMLAVRAGASHVYACELEPRLAQTAREIVAANGFANQITILPAHSSKLDRDLDLAGGVDVVISEIFSDNLLGEGVLPSLEDARKRLCRPNAVFLPARADIRVALAAYAAGTPPSRFTTIEAVEDIDLSLFNRHLPRHQNFLPASDILTLKSAPVNLFSFDFQSPSIFDEKCSFDLESHGGTVHGFVQWIRFETASGHKYENYPGCPPGASWQIRFHCFDKPFASEPGELIRVNGWHNDKNLFIWNSELPGGRPGSQ